MNHESAAGGSIYKGNENKIGEEMNVYYRYFQIKDEPTLTEIEDAKTRETP